MSCTSSRQVNKDYSWQPCIIQATRIPLFVFSEGLLEQWSLNQSPGKMLTVVGLAAQEKLWEGQCSGIRRFPMSSLLFYFPCCASCSNRQPTFPSSTPNLLALERWHWWQPPQENKCQCLDWSAVWYLTFLSISLLIISSHNFTVLVHFHSFLK